MGKCVVGKSVRAAIQGPLRSSIWSTVDPRLFSATPTRPANTGAAPLAILTTLNTDQSHEPGLTTTSIRARLARLDHQSEPG